MWWLVLSAIFFFTNALLVGALAYAVFKLGGAVAEMRPKVEGLVETVDSVAKKVDGLATTLQATVKSVGDKASGVASSASIMANTTSKVFERFAPLLGIVLTGLKIFGSIQEYRAAHRKPELPERD